MSNTMIQLAIDSDKLNSFCDQLIRRSRDREKTHDSLVTLEAFITRFCQDSQGSSEFQQAIAVIRRHSDKTREQLLSEKAERLITALRSLDKAAITDIYLPLSRNGFQEILQSIVPRFSELELSIIAQWSHEWLSYSKHKAETASEYPDAPDFRKAGISMEEYRAMEDVDRFLYRHVSQQTAA